MKPTNFKEANKILKAPSGSDNVDDMRVFDDGQHIISKWEFSFKERLQVLFKGHIWQWTLTSNGTQPPIALDLAHPFVRQPEFDESRLEIIKPKVATTSKGTPSPTVVVYGNMYIKVSDRNISIENSYVVKKRKHQQKVLGFIRENVGSKVLDNRNDWSMKNEWVSHNNLYRLGIQKNRTKDVDLDYPQKWYYKVGYFILSIITI